MAKFWLESVHRAALSLGLLFLCTLHSPAHCRLLPGQLMRVQRFLKHIIAQQKMREVAVAIRSGTAMEGFVPIGQIAKMSEMAMAPGAPGPSTPPSTSTGCPPSASDCDFFFQNSQGTIPVFNISNVSPDSPISPPIVTSLQGTTISVLVLNSGQSQYLCNSTGLVSDNQFYTSGMFVQTRTVQPGTLGNYLNQFVRLNLEAIQINAFGTTFNLNPGQGNNFFPEERRCIIFQVA